MYTWIVISSIVFWWITQCVFCVFRIYMSPSWTKWCVAYSLQKSLLWMAPPRHCRNLPPPRGCYCTHTSRRRMQCSRHVSSSELQRHNCTACPPLTSAHCTSFCTGVRPILWRRLTTNRIVVHSSSFFESFICNVDLNCTLFRSMRRFCSEWFEHVIYEQHDPAGTLILRTNISCIFRDRFLFSIIWLFPFTLCCRSCCYPCSPSGIRGRIWSTCAFPSPPLLPLPLPGVPWRGLLLVNWWPTRRKMPWQIDRRTDKQTDKRAESTLFLPGANFSILLLFCILL